MNNVFFKMQLKPGFSEEYKRRHNSIWPELKELLVHAGIVEYYIALDEETGTLFAMQKQSETFNGNELSAHPVMEKWWQYMADIMETNDDLSPVCFPLEEMFSLI